MSFYRAKKFEKLWLFSFFVLTPLFVMPCFLNYAIEAKTTLLIFFLLLITFETKSIFFSSKLYDSKTILLILWAICLILNFLICRDKYIALWGLRNLFLPLLISFFLYQKFSLKDCLYYLSLGGGIIAALGLIQIFFDIRLGTPSSDPGQFPAVTFGNRGMASFFVALSLLASFPVRAKRFLKLSYFFVGLKCCFLILSATRGVLLSTLVAVFFLKDYLFNLKKHKINKLYSTLFFLAMMAFVFFLVKSNPLVNKLFSAQRFNLDALLNNERLAIWIFCFKQYFSTQISQILLGLGPGHFSLYFTQWVAEQSTSKIIYLDLHNDYLQYILEYGVLSSGLILLFFIIIITNALKNENIVTQANPTLKALAALIVCYSFFLYTWQVPYFASIFYFVFFSLLKPKCGSYKKAKLIGLHLKLGQKSVFIFLLSFYLWRNITGEILMKKMVKTPNKKNIHLALNYIENKSFPFIYRMYCKQCLYRSKII